MIDIEFMAESFSALCGMPVRIYKNNKLSKSFSLIDFKYDPISIDIEEILKRKESIGYYINEYFYYYGFINYKNNMFIVGPSREIKIDNINLNMIASRISFKREEDIKEFKEKMMMLVPMPLSSLIQSLISLNYVLNDEKKTLKDILVDYKPLSYEVFDALSDIKEIHNYYDVEKRILKIIEEGDIESFNEFEKEPQSFRRDEYTSDLIRNMKDNFIIAIALISRKAIDSGMDFHEALNIEILYINKLELMSNPNEIRKLEYLMVKEYINKINKIKNFNPLIRKINKYILNNLDKFISIEELSKELYLSRGTLCFKVKNITGLTVNEYINKYKVEYSKELIDKGLSFSSIAFSLGYSSQQHFTNMFKKILGITPKSYRNKETNKC